MDLNSGPEPSKLNVTDGIHYNFLE